MTIVDILELWRSSNFRHDDMSFLCHFAFLDAGRRIARYRMRALAVVEAGSVMANVQLGFCMVRIRTA
ncbi:hypothetical protein DNF23_45770 [Pseudomonas syringae pv. pisi]